MKSNKLLDGIVEIKHGELTVDDRSISKSDVQDFPLTEGDEILYTIENEEVKVHILWECGIE